MIAGSAPELREVARYGTLIDWETGILAGLRAALAAHRVDGTGDELLGAYADAEATLENGPYFPYREILVGGLRAIAASLGTTVADGEAAAFGGSVADWPAFRHPASAGSLAVGSWLRRGPGPTPVAQGIQLKEPVGVGNPDSHSYRPVPADLGFFQNTLALRAAGREERLQE